MGLHWLRQSRIIKRRNIFLNRAPVHDGFGQHWIAQLPFTAIGVSGDDPCINRKVLIADQTFFDAAVNRCLEQLP